MKTSLTMALALISLLAIAQQRNSLNRSINDDGKILSIRVNGTVNGSPINYDRTFDVSGLNKDERHKLQERVLDSLNINMPEPPEPPASPRGPQDAPHNRESVTIISGDGPTVSVNSDDALAVTVGGKKPYTKEVRYNSEAGKLYVRYQFKRDGEDMTYERTVDVRDKSQDERQRIIDGIEKEIGVPKTGK